MKNYYEILEVDKNASEEVIDKAYKTLVKKNHPDLKEGEEKNLAEEKIKLINEAYDVLSNSSKREQYNALLYKTQVSNEEYEKVIREKEILQNELNNIRNNSTSVNSIRSNANINANSNANTYHSTNSTDGIDPLRNPVQYYSKTIKNYVKSKKRTSNTARKVYDENELKNIYKNAYNKAYYDAYIQDLKRRGYKIRYKKTFQDYIKMFIKLVIIVIVLFILWHIPFINKFLKNIYENVAIVKIVVDIFTNIVKSLFSTITNTSLL